MATFLQVKNRATSALASGIDASVTSLTVTTGEGSKFPQPGNGFHITINDEILKCTARTTDSLTVVRAQEGTSAAIHSSGASVSLNITAGVLESRTTWTLNKLLKGAGADVEPTEVDVYTDAKAKAAAVQSGAIVNGVTKAPTHDAVYDVKATADAATTPAEAKAQAEGAKLDDHAAPDDNTDLDASAAKHGLMPKLDKSKLDDATSAATASKIVIRDAQGQAAFAAPAENGDALIKGTRATTAELPAMTDEKIWKGTGGNVEESDDLTNLIDTVDAATQDFQVEHEDRNAAGALKVYSDFVWIPRFVTAGFDAAMQAKGFRNGVELGGFGIAKYQMSHPLATMATKGGVDGVNWGGTYAAMSLPQKCAWTYISWDETILACDAMNQKVATNDMLVDDISSSTSTADGATGNTIVDNTIAGGAANKLAGNNLEIVRTEGAGTTTYYRRIRRVDRNLTTMTFCPSLPYGLITALAGDNNDIRYTRKNSGADEYINIVYADGGASGTMAAARSGSGISEAPYVITVTFYDNDNLASAAITAIRADADSHAIVHVENAPGNSGAGAVVAMAATSLAQFNTINSDTYTLKKFTLWGPYEWATMKYLTAMRYAVNGYPYPKGNNDYGKDIGDADEFQYYGRNDPDADPGEGYELTKVLTGTGPKSWYHNGQLNGVWGLNGNVWQWCKAKDGGAGEDHCIDAGFMGEALILPANNNYLAGIATVGDSGVPDLALPSSVGNADLDFGSDYYYEDIGARAFLVGGFWRGGVVAGVFGLCVDFAVSHRNTAIGFRAVL